MYFILKALARTLVLPPSGPLLLCGVGLILIGRHRQRIGWSVLITGLVSSWLLATPIVADGLAGLAERYPPLDPNAQTGAQAIVILGGGGERLAAPEYGGPVADGVLLERLTYGAFLAHRSGLPLLVTGTPREAQVMQVTLLRNFGLTTRWVDDQSRDTYENAYFSARALRSAGVTRIILVTSSTHLWRATHEFEDVGLEVVPAPAGVLAPRETGPFRWLPAPAALMRSHAALYELIGEPFRRLQHALGIRERLDRRTSGLRTSGTT